MCTIHHALLWIACGVLAAPALAQSSAPAPAAVSGAQRQVDAEHAWQVTLRHRVMRAARPQPDWPEGRHEIVMGFRVARDGSISAPSLLVGTGYPQIDAQPGVILGRVGRLPPFPDGMTGESRYFRIPVVFDMRKTDSRIDVLPPHRFHVDQRNGWSITVPANLAVLGARERPGFVGVVSVGANAQGPRPLPGSKRLCDIALRDQQPGLAARSQAQLNLAAHQEGIARILTAGHADRASVTSPAAVTFGRGVQGQEVVLTPADAPDSRRYVALADTPVYRLAVTCGTVADDIDRALPLFRALAARLIITR